MKAWRSIPGAIGAALVLVAVARGSAAHVRWQTGDAAELRLSWTARPERIEQCRALSAEEIAKQPEHMRQRVACTGHLASYALDVVVDGVVVAHDVVRGGGVRHDRALYVLRSVDIKSGAHRIAVSFTRRETDSSSFVAADSTRAEPDTGIFAGRAARENEERRERALAAIAPRIALDTTITIAPSSVVLITYDATLRALQVHRDAQLPR